MPNYIRPRGTLDLYENQAQIYQTIIQTCQKIAQLYGYQMIQTPMFESTTLFSRTTGESSDIVTKEMYQFLDKGGRDFSLRPEGTAGVIRAVIENKLYATRDLPLKYDYVGSFFRYERPQAGRYREFMQFGVEVIGTRSYLDDVETILMISDILKKLHLDQYVVKINSFGNASCRKQYRDVLKDYFLPFQNQLCEDCQKRLQTNPLRILDCKVDKDFFLKQKDIPTALSVLDESSSQIFEETKKILKAQQIPFVVDSQLVRGLDYYTGLIFEIEIHGKDGKVYTIGGGGHYSDLMKELGGPDLECVGFGLGINRLALLLEEKFGLEAYALKKEIYVLTLDDSLKSIAMQWSHQLRQAGFYVTMETQHKSGSSMFKYAAKHQFHYAVIFGEDELKNQQVAIKDLKLQKQEVISLDEMIPYFKEVLK